MRKLLWLGVHAYKNEEGGMFTNYWVLDAPPHWEGYPEEINRAYGFNFGVESVAGVEIEFSIA